MRELLSTRIKRTTSKYRTNENSNVFWQENSKIIMTITKAMAAFNSKLRIYEEAAKKESMESEYAIQLALQSSFNSPYGRYELKSFDKFY
jgi:hypothetical protein